jgi:peptidoglycan/LPS O-acetylase OafA/YrhL
MVKIPELNGLRGIAAFLIFVAHAAKTGFLPSFIEKQYGQMALLVLFVLSGFLISHQYLYREFTKENIFRYVISRASRVFPAYVLVLIVSYIISSFFYPEFRYNFEDERILFFALFCISAPYELWSIPVEVQFYFTFIFIWLIYQNFSKKFWVLLIVPLAMLIPGILFYMESGRTHTIWLYAISFFIGTTLSFLINNKTISEWFKKTPKALSVFLFLLTLFFVPLFRKVLGPYLAPAKVILVISSFLFIITNPANFRFLTVKPLLFMGEISFAFYLMHRPVIELGKSIFGSTPLCFALTLAVTIVFAALSTFLFEKPAMGFIKKISFSERTKNRLNVIQRLF